MNHDGTVNPDELKRIAQSTGGAFYTTSSADDLPEIFNQIFAREMRSVLMPVAGVTASGKLQEVQVEIPNSSMSEANIILLSARPLKDAQLFYESKNIRLFKSNSYTLLKITAPKKGTATLKFKGSSGDLVKISLLGSYAMEAKARLTDGKAIKGKPAGIEALLIDAISNEPLQEKELYQGLSAELVVLDKAANTETAVEMKNEGTRFYAEHTFSASGEYEWYVKMEGDTCFRNTPATVQKIVNLAPVVQGKEQLQLTKEDGPTELDLNTLFLDENGGQAELCAAGCGRQGGPGRTGRRSIKHFAAADRRIGADDYRHRSGRRPGHGASGAENQIQIYGAEMVHRRRLVLALIGVALYFWLRPKPAFAGKLEGYFLATASGSEVPVKSWPLTSFPGRTVNLGELFQSLDVNERCRKRGTFSLRRAREAP
ncbi:hypothetical protein HMSSN036_39910 [Paenibacillus macerans]|nr:hypothetical protein HMSSN036_39910 [Paenibacillus macerans]